MGSTTGTRVRFAGVDRQLTRLRAELLAACEEVIDGGRLVLGEQVERFERELEAVVGAPHAVGVASGTDAIELGLRALGIGAGDEVVTQANTCVPTVAAIERSGATPVLCDADPATASIVPDSLAAAIGSRTRAVVVVHLYGQTAPMDEVVELTGRHGIHVVEDCAQALGADHRGRPAGTIGAAGCFSFYPTKNLGALGDAGAVVFGDAELAGKARRLRTYGQDGGESIDSGVNSRIDELQAALLRVKLQHLAEEGRRRDAIAAHYDAALVGTPVRPVAAPSRGRHARHLYVVLAPDRDAFREALAGRGIETLVHYPRAIHEHRAYTSLGERAPLPGAEDLATRVVSLPLHPDLTDDEVDAVAAAARAAALDGARAA